jgi:hypothetical protein
MGSGYKVYKYNAFMRTFEKLSKNVVETLCDSARGWTLPIDPVEIAEQREKGWPDFHPETYCHRCGQRNLHSWATAHDLWSQACETGLMPGSHIVCPQCFTEMWETATGRAVSWTLSIDDPGAAVYATGAAEADDLERDRSAITGWFVSEEYAETHPDTTVTESGSSDV